MAHRKVRHRDLLEALDLPLDNPEASFADDQMEDRALHKDELQVVCKNLSIDPDGTVPELRNRLRDSGWLPDWTSSPNKVGSSRFNTQELRYLNRAVLDVTRLDAHELDFEFSDVEWRQPAMNQPGDLLVVDGEEYVLDYRFSGPNPGTTAEEELPMDRYEIYRFNEGRVRLVVLHGLDMEEHSYKHSVALEKAVGYGPWLRWKWSSYVQEVEHVSRT